MKQTIEKKSVNWSHSLINNTIQYEIEAHKVNVN